MWNASRLAIVNSPSTIASVRNEPASAAARMFGRITLSSVRGQLAPRLCDASVSVCTSIDAEARVEREEHVREGEDDVRGDEEAPRRPVEPVRRALGRS